MKRLTIAALALLLTGALVLPALAAGQGGEWTGWITDEHCGAKGAKAGHKDCALKCYNDGGKLVFYNDADKKLYKIDKQEVAKEHLDHRVTINGTVDGDSIKIESIQEAGKA